MRNLVHLGRSFCLANSIFCIFQGFAIFPQYMLQLYADGIRGLRVRYLYKQLVAPMLACLAIHLSSPRVICSLLSTFIEVSKEEQIIFLRYSYPATLLCVFCVYFIYWQCTKIKALAEKIRNDKYGSSAISFWFNCNSVRVFWGF